jgi:hypothetical protein
MNDKDAVIAGQARGDETFSKPVDSFTLVGREPVDDKSWFGRPPANENIALTGGKPISTDAGRIGDWSQTWTGTRFYPRDPRPEDVKIEDLIMGLGNMTRYNGQCKFFAVAEHTVIASHMAMDDEVLKVCGVPDELEKYTKEELAWMMLHHDDPEFLMADMTRPFKRAIGRDNEYFRLEDEIYRKAIAPRFGLPEKLPQTVMNIDVAVLALEKKVLHPRSDPWHLPFQVPARRYKIHCWLPPHSQFIWLRRYCELGGYAEQPLRNRILELMAEDRRALQAQFDPAEVSAA